MSTVLLVGAGAVGVRAGRQLLETAGVERLLVADRRRTAAAAAVTALGPGAVIHDDGLELDGVDAVACAAPPASAPEVVAAAVEAGVPAAAVCDAAPALREALAHHRDAVERGVAVVVGCGLAPGLADVLARHAAALFDEVEDVHVARAGTAGPACVATLRRELAERAVEVRDGAARPCGRSAGPALVWFPEPVGGLECRPAASGVELLPAAVPGVARATYRLAEPPRRRLVPRRSRLADGWGAARVEVWGRAGAERASVVYGVIERTAVAAGTVLAVTTACLAGASPGAVHAAPGVHPLGAVADPVPFLAELDRRGVKAAVFEGVALG